MYGALCSCFANILRRGANTTQANTSFSTFLDVAALLRLDFLRGTFRGDFLGKLSAGLGAGSVSTTDLESINWIQTFLE